MFPGALTYPGRYTYPGLATGVIGQPVVGGEASQPVIIANRRAALQVLPTTYELDGLVLGDVDEDGCWWIVRNVTGWRGSAKPKTNRTPRTFGAGSYRSASWRGERVIILTGTTKCPNRSVRLDAMDRLAALCSDPGAMYSLKVTDVASCVARTADVELDDRVDPVLAGERWFDWQLQVAAPDPRKRDVVWQEPIATVPLPGSGGLDIDAGLDPTGGLDFGSSSAPAIAKVGNYGNAAASPLFTLHGPAAYPQIVDTVHGWALTYAGVLGTTDTLTINADAFPQRGYAGHAVLINGAQTARTYLNVTTDWPLVEAQGTGTFELWSNAPGTADTELTVSFRSAWN